MNIDVSPLTRTGLGVLCLVMLGMLFWVIRHLFKERRNDLHHIQLTLDQLVNTVDKLPCVKVQLKKIATLDPEHFLDHGPDDPHP